MLKLKLQYFGHFMWRFDSLEKTDAGRDWGQEEKGTTEDEMAGWHHWLDGREFEWTPGDGDGQGGRDAIHGVAKSRTRLSDWTELNTHNAYLQRIIIRFKIFSKLLGCVETLRKPKLIFIQNFARQLYLHAAAAAAAKSR